MQWQKQVQVASEEDTTVEAFALEFPTSLSSAHFVKLWLKEDDKVVSDNFYIRGTEEGNFQAIKQMPKVALEQTVANQKGENGEWTGSVTLKNPTATPALMIRVNVVGDKDGDQILPIIYSDNYIALIGGEQKQITFRLKDVDTRGNAPKVVVTGYNVE